MTFNFAADQNGTSLITVRATDRGSLFVEDTFLVTVNPVNDDPVVLNPVLPVTVDEDAPDLVIDLDSVFDDVDILTNGDALAYLVQSNSEVGLASTSISGNFLSIEFHDDQSGDTRP